MLRMTPLPDGCQYASDDGRAAGQLNFRAIERFNHAPGNY